MPTPLPPKGTVLQTAEFADSLYFPVLVACGSRDIRDIVSACTVWFTFVFRTPTPRAVEDFIVKVLLASRGARHSASALLPSFVS